MNVPEKTLQTNDEHNLKIRISNKRVSYVLENENVSTVLRQDINFSTEHEYDGTLLTRVFNQPELRLKNENVSVLYEYGDYQLVPSELYREEYQHDFFEIYQGELEKKVLETALLPKWGIHFMYALPEAATLFMRQLYPDATHEHHVFQLLKKQVDKSSEKMYVNVREEVLDIVVVQDKALQLVNSFSLKSIEDAIYFILNIFEQLELDVATFPMVLIFADNINDDLVDILKKYVVHVELIKK